MTQLGYCPRKPSSAPKLFNDVLVRKNVWPKYKSKCPTAKKKPFLTLLQNSCSITGQSFPFSSNAFYTNTLYWICSCLVGCHLHASNCSIWGGRHRCSNGMANHSRLFADRWSVRRGALEGEGAIRGVEGVGAGGVGCGCCWVEICQEWQLAH